MNSKKSIIRATAFVLIAVLVALSANIFAAAKELSLEFEVQSAPVEAGNAFTVGIKISNPESVSEKNLAGLQVELAYDTTKLTASDSDIAVAEDVTSQSMYVTNIKDGKAILVCIKSQFSDTAGYETLEKLFTVTFTANEKIEDPTKLFTKDNLTFVLGNTLAETVESTAVYYGNVANIAKSLKADSNVKVASDYIFEGSNMGSIAILPTPSLETPSTLEHIMSYFADSSKITIQDADGTTITDNTAKVGTGCTITYTNGASVEHAVIIVKGDLDGSGTVTAFDAALSLRTIAGLMPNYTAIQKCAADVTGENAEHDVSDAAMILRYSAKNITVFAK